MSPDSLIEKDQACSPLRRNGLFAREEDEYAFLRSEWDYIGARLRSIGLWGGLAFMLAAFTDYTVLRFTPVFFGIFALRFVVLGVGIWLFQLGRRPQPDHPRYLARVLLTFEVAILGIFLLVVAAYRGAVDYHAITALLLTIALYAYAPALSEGSLWIGPAFTIVFLLEAVFVLHAEPKASSIVAILLVFANFAGWQVAIQLSRIHRLNWLDRQQLRHEVAERVAAEQRALTGEENLRRLFDTTPVPMVLTQHPGGRVLRYNEAAERLLDPAGKIRAGLVPFSADFYADPMQFAQLREQLLRDGRIGPLDVEFKTTEGRTLDAMLSSAVMPYHGEPAIISSLVEITARKRHERELQHMAHTDSLTGLLNRRGFLQRADALLQDARVRGTSIAVLLIDADYFKRINDSHGHAVGDEALKQIGAIVQGQLREADTLGRVGGEEFACLLPDTERMQALDVAERIRTAAAAQGLQCGNVHLPISLSVGVSMVQAHEQRINEALNRADRAMYMAKEGGRNRVEIHAAEA